MNVKDWAGRKDRAAVDAFQTRSCRPITETSAVASLGDKEGDRQVIHITLETKNGLFESGRKYDVMKALRHILSRACYNLFKVKQDFFLKITSDSQPAPEKRSEKADFR